MPINTLPVAAIPLIILTSRLLWCQVSMSWPQ
jgi:hypothetical protein